MVTKLELTGGTTPFDAADPRTFPDGFSTFEDELVTDLAGKVGTTGDETVAGVKTFSSSPVVPAPTTDLQAATKKYVDDNAGGGGGDGRYHALDPSLPTRQTNWNVVEIGANYHRYHSMQGDGTDGATMEFDVYMESGTYTAILYYTASSNRPIVSIQIDTVEVGSVDQYNATTNTRTVANVTGINVTTSGYVTIALVVNGKNASSSNFYGQAAIFGFVRTGAST